MNGDLNINWVTLIVLKSYTPGGAIAFGFQ